MKVKQLFERFSQPMQTVTIVEVFDPRLSSEYLWEGYVKDISSKFLNRDVFSWCAGYQNDYMLNAYYKTDIVVSIDGTRNESYSRKESKSRARKRSIKEDIDDYEIIASFKSSNFCVGDFEDVEQDLLDLVLSDEQALKELISFLRDVGYPVEGDEGDFDAEDYVDWFGTELYECISVDKESDLSFGHFKFKQKNLHNYY